MLCEVSAWLQQIVVLVLPACLLGVSKALKAMLQGKPRLLKDHNIQGFARQFAKVQVMPAITE